MGISSGGFGRPFPLGPALVQTRTTCQGQPGAACPLSGCLGSHLGAQRPVARPAPGGGAVRYCVPFGWSRLLRGLGAQRPGGPACPAGVPISPEKWGERGPGAVPPGPPVLWPLAAARSFWRSCRIVPVMGLFRCPSSYPDLGTFFHKMLFQHIFYSKMRPKSVLAYRRKQPLERIRDNNRQNERAGTSGP